MHCPDEPAPQEGEAAIPASSEVVPIRTATAPLDNGSGGTQPAPEIPTTELAVPPAPATRIKVLVIDDELAGLTAAHLRDLAGPFVTELEDVNSPTTEAVWGIVAALTGRPGFNDADPGDIAAYFASDQFVREVVLSEQLRNAALPTPDFLHRFYDQERGVRELRTMLEAAYAAPNFELTFRAARPNAPVGLMEYDLVVLDLVLAQSAGAVDELVTYLAALSSNLAELPCLIVLSSREEMVDNRPRFTTDSNISAAGLLLLEKRHVRQSQFGATGLQLSYEQLARQRDVAQKIRMFVRAWTESLEGAMKSAAETLWNLDAAAMQEIHLSANSDDDPYDAHLSELVSREYLWHVEGAAPVTQAIDALDAAFQAHLQSENGKLSIKERYIAPYADPKPGRTLVSHYNWTGFNPTGRLDQHSAADLALRFNRLVPFGAVLAPEAMAAGAECWVHITQQCDLNSAVRISKPGDSPDGKVSAMFAVATAVVVSDRRLPDHNTQDLVARGLRVGNQEYDLKLVNGRLISLPISQLIETALRDRRQVVGRLRHDIATQFLSATANHMTRPAQLKATRVEVRPAQLFLWGKDFNDNQPLPFLGVDGTPRTLQVSTNNKLYYFADDTSMWVALWLTDQARTKLGKAEVAPAKVYSTVRGGVRKGGNVVSVINLQVEIRAFDQIGVLWNGKQPDRATLYLIHEPDLPVV